MADERETTNTDPFTVLGVTEDAGDEAIKRRYLALVRAYPPDREPERFQTYRRAYEAIRGPRERLEAKLLQSRAGALVRLKRHCLEAEASEPKASPGRASLAAVIALIADGLERTATD